MGSSTAREFGYDSAGAPGERTAVLILLSCQRRFLHLSSDMCDMWKMNLIEIAAFYFQLR